MRSGYTALQTGAGRPQSHPLLKRATTGYIWFEQHSAPCCVIVPEKGSKASLLIRIWDDLIIVVLLIEAFWAPLVFAFPPFYNFYYRAFSRLQDVLLSADIAANFFVAVPKDIDGGSRNLWEKRSSRIAKRYVIPSTQPASGFFWLDLLAVLPGWKEVLYDRQLLSTRIEGEAATVIGALLRWTRFGRLVRSMRGLTFAKSVEHYRVEAGLPHWLTDAILLGFVLLLSCHVAACTFITFEGKVSPGYFSWTKEVQMSWLEAVLQRGDPCLYEAGSNPMCVYTLAFYWAAATLTTVGYGDITPQNQIEYIVSSVIMVAFGFVWAFIVGATVKLLSTVDPVGNAHKQETDHINRMMERLNLSNKLKLKMRRYLVERYHVDYDHQERSLLRQVFPQGLQARVAAESPVCGYMLQNIYWAKDLSSDTLHSIVTSLEASFHPPHELVHIRGTMVVVWSGLLAAKGRILVRGDCYGFSDILLTNTSLHEATNPRAVTYVDILSLHKDALRSICEDDPEADKRLRRAQVRTAVLRGFVKASKRLNMDSPYTFSSPTVGTWTAALDSPAQFDRSASAEARPDIMEELRRMEQRLSDKLAATSRGSQDFCEVPLIDAQAPSRPVLT
mmetsp:Transcript_7859/g.18341  ORF Transcript_7859/g.18341 Transcript_7859/m.18341 type:complete len:617 (-) Transcript_7859:55-1905(-)